MPITYMTTLADLPVGKSCRICTVYAAGLTRQRLLNLGFVPGTIVKSLHRSPLSDPTAYLIRGTIIALRREDAAMIAVSV